MLKSREFLSGKSRGIFKTSPLAGEVGALLRVRGNNKPAGGTKPASPAPVILCLVHRILWKQGSNLVNKFALLLHKYWLREDSWDKPKNDGCWVCVFSLVVSKQKSVALGNKVMDTRLPQPAGCGDKYDVSGLGLGRLLSAFCESFKYPSPEVYAAPSPSRGEGLHRPWCHKILGTDCASRPRMTGGRGANFFGRSMIEMLGVLAIIGVLSVGGIAGYSKAMEKYKLNKVTEQYSYLFQGLLEHGDSLRLSGPEDKFLTNIVTALNLVPTSWTLNSNNLSFIDDYGNNVGIITRNKEFVFNLGFRNAELNTKTCEAFFQNVFQPLHAYMNRIHFYDMKSVNQQYMYYGDTMCSNGRLCLRDMTVSDIHKACGYCSIKEGSGCFLVVYF